MPKLVVIEPADAVTSDGASSSSATLLETMFIGLFAFENSFVFKNTAHITDVISRQFNSWVRF